MKPWISGIVIGVVSGLLYILGNPENMGICVACFERDIIGAIGMHRALPVQYFRPEIPGMVLGAMVAALAGREFLSKGVSSPLFRLLLGFFGMIGALVFLGCPWRAFLRLAGGDLNSLVGLAGLVAGIAVAFKFTERGFHLGHPRVEPGARSQGFILPLILLAGVSLSFFYPSFGEGKAFFRSVSGPASQAAPFIYSLGAAMIVGFFGYRSRFCSIAAFRNAMFFRDRSYLLGVGALIAVAFTINSVFMGLSADSFIEFGFRNMPISHSNVLWNFLGMFLAGMAFSLGEGCPARQLFKAGGGDLNSVLVVVGMFTGAAFAHNFGLASVPDKIIDGVTVIGGPSPAGMIAVGIGIVYCLVLGFQKGKQRNANSERGE